MSGSVTRVREGWRRIKFEVLLVLLVVSVSENVVLTLKLKRVVTHRSDGADQALAVGEVISDLAAKDLSGSMQRVDFAEEKVLFVFSASCPACQKNLQNWRAIESLGPKGRVLYLSTDSVPTAKEYAERKGISKNTFVFAGNDEKRRFKVFQVPQTIYVSDGRVQAIHVGILSPQDIATFSHFARSASRSTE